MDVDYSLYLVTDSSPEITQGQDFFELVEAGIDGGVTIVQFREKTGETSNLVATAKRLHALTREDGIPLIINDRVDVALAVGAEGVHLGQDDLDYATARKTLGDNAIIGVTVSSSEEAIAAATAGANYLGIGTVFATPTKTDTKAIIGIGGVNQILQSLEDAGLDVPAVAIGGINSTNARQVVAESSTSSRRLAGVAVVSAIMSMVDPYNAAVDLRDAAAAGLFDVSGVASYVRKIAQKTPLSHNMTNLVVQNFAANVALAVGGSPIMAGNGDEAADLAQIPHSALVINMGSCDPGSVDNYVKALRAYNAERRPVLLDPVGCGATKLRRQAARTLLRSGRFTVIKGNEGEIKALLEVGEPREQQRGVDSAPSDRTLQERTKLARALSQREGTTVVMTGKTDIVARGHDAYAVGNGHELLGRITGSGCTLGTVISCCLAMDRMTGVLACIAGLVFFEIAAERAARMPGVNGPGTFVPAFIDQLAAISAETSRGDEEWLKAARIYRVYSDRAHAELMKTSR